MDYKCEECPAPCILKTKYVATKPDKCPFNTFIPDWKLSRNQDKKIEKAIHKTFNKLNVLLAIYVGEKQIERGDYFTHEEVWKGIERKIKNARSKETIKNTENVRTRKPTNHK